MSSSERIVVKKLSTQPCKATGYDKRKKIDEGTCKQNSKHMKLNIGLRLDEKCVRVSTNSDELETSSTTAELAVRPGCLKCEGQMQGKECICPGVYND